VTYKYPNLLGFSKLHLPLSPVETHLKLCESLVALGALDQKGICSCTWLVGMGILDPGGSRIAVLRRLVVVEQSGGQRGN